jgi:hypothetical protein
MYEISVLREAVHKYRRFSLNDNIGELCVEKLSSLLRSVTSITINGDVNINNGNNNNITSRCTTVDKIQQAREWITANLPTEREVTTEYYARYTASGASVVVINQFGKLVRELGYKTIQNSEAIMGAIFC